MLSRSATEKAREELGVGPLAGRQEVRRAYVRLARRWHPDRVRPEDPDYALAEDRMKAVNEAYRILSVNGGWRSATASRPHPPPRPHVTRAEVAQNWDPRVCRDWSALVCRVLVGAFVAGYAGFVALALWCCR